MSIYDVALVAGYGFSMVGFLMALMGCVLALIPLLLGLGIWAASGWLERF